MHQLIKLRKSKGMTQGELAELLGVTANTISQYERGKRNPNIVMLKKIANVLNCKLEDLI